MCDNNNRGRKKYHHEIFLIKKGGEDKSKVRDLNVIICTLQMHMHLHICVCENAQNGDGSIASRLATNHLSEPFTPDMLDIVGKGRKRSLNICRK